MVLFVIAVNLTLLPGEGGVHWLESFPFQWRGQPWLSDAQLRLTRSLGLPQSGSSHVHVFPSTWSAGNGLKGSAGLLAGQETMNMAANVYTDVGSSG